MLKEADYIVIGGGSAGCAIASRLSEDHGNSVILIEAGGSGRGWKVDMPAGSVFLVGHEPSDWRYLAEPDPTLNGRAIRWAGGRMLGGGSAINAQLYIRGLRSDFDGWEAGGCAGWGFDAVLPFFKKAEGFDGANPPPSHGLNGKLAVSRPRTTHPLLKNFTQGFQELGLPYLEDYCAGDQFGVFRALATQRRGQRCSAAKAYLEPAMKRANLHIITGAFAQRLTGADGRIAGVEIARGGEISQITARREVILSAGAIASPALLLRSGIGAGEALQRLGIVVRHDLPGVGRNLQEHPAILLNRFVDVPTYNSQMSLYHQIRMGLQYLISKRGPLTSLGGQGVAFAKTRSDLSDPDVQYLFSGATYDLDAEGKAIMDARPGVLISVIVCRPYSRGKIGIGDAGAQAMPVISHRTYEDPRDMETMMAGCRLGERLFETAAFRSHVTGRYSPERPLESDQEWEAFIRRKTLYAWHPSGTCKMGVGPQAVVDPSLKLRGMAGLRVADASIMPNLISANTNATCIMIGEKAADLIRQEARA